MSENPIETERRVYQVAQAHERLNIACEQLTGKIEAMRKGVAPEEIADELLDMGNTVFKLAGMVRLRLEQLAVG